MADAALSGLVSDVLRSLASTTFQEIGRLQRLEADISALNDTYTQIQAILNDAEVRQKKEKSVETWLNTLRSASLEVENILDNAIAEAMLQRLHNERGIKYKVRAFFSSDYNPLLVRTRAANKVKTIRRKLDRVAANRSQFNFISDEVSVDERIGGETINMETSSLVPMSKIYGRDEEVKMVAEKICSKERIEHRIEGVRVYAIWGMGGVGKTTLAQLVYNHEMVKAHFELQSWVHVSSEFQVKKITREIIESIDKRPCELSQLDAMQVELQNKLRGKRLFIVLDDVWIEDKDMKKWEELSKALNSGAEGSIVMMTSRNQTTSRMMAKDLEFRHKVGCLSKEDSWSLFEKLAFAFGTEREGENIRELESIGKEIVDKCEGLPLAVKILGGLMSSKRSVSEWQSVKHSDFWEFQENDILPVLKLSYNSLLPHLKRCFAYCCLFPKGYEMRKVLLIELWMVNGFLPTRREVDLYVIGDEIFCSLVSRSFLQDVQEDRNSMDLVCKMHDLMHDLARDVMRHDCVVIEPGKELITPDEVLHLSSSCSDISFLDHDLKRLRSLRSLFIFVDEYKGNMISQISKHVCLRVLRLDGIQVSTLPESISKLKHLRYLSLSRSEIVSLPESIIFLQNLQVLLVKQCRSLRKLPKGMRYMKNLRCLDNQGCNELDYMPVGMKELACLGRLGKFVVGKEKGAQIRELGDLNLLWGRLELRGLENVGGLDDAKSANLKHKTNLISLVLFWLWRSNRFQSDEEICRLDEEVIEGLEPNSRLKELSIQNYMGKMICPNWMMKLENMVKIEFKTCGRCESIPSLGKLPSLRVIHLHYMCALTCFDDDEFPSLRELKIEYCQLLVSLPSNLPKLEKLNLTGIPGLISLSSNLPELKSLAITTAFFFVSLPSNLPKLEKLTLSGVWGLDSLPSNLPKLKKLALSGVWCLVSLGTNLPKLTELDIDTCPRLHSLPNGLKKLTLLTIRKCEELERRCQKETGEDWSKISHVPDLRICTD